MDDSLEIPSALPQKTPLSGQQLEENEQQSSDEEDGGLDWTKLMPSSARPIIPRRGEKEFEPRAGGGTNLQLHVLDRSRQAMFDTLRATRTISSKAVSYAIWRPDIWRTEVTLARGTHFSNMGHSAPRSVTEDGVAKVQKGLELLPEETIYLIERGSVFCWKETDLDLGKIPGLNAVAGSPMTVQQAYSEMIGKEDLTLEKYQVYSYLKRLGYVVSRAVPLDNYYPVPSNLFNAEPSVSVLQKTKLLFSSWVLKLSRVFLPAFNWWQPIDMPRWLCHSGKYSSLFQSMRLIPAGHHIPLKNDSTTQARSTSSYQIFYNVYKPSTPFKKSAPPPPDFQLVVINARTTPMPTLQEMTYLFDITPEPPLLTFRPRRPPQGTATTAPVTVQPYKNNIPPTQPLIQRIFSWFYSPEISSTPGRRPNPFMALKLGKKHVLVAAVDAGNTSFFRFGQGEFKEWPMV